jgi:hypothetical protein
MVLSVRLVVRMGLFRLEGGFEVVLDKQFFFSASDNATHFSS